MNRRVLTVMALVVVLTGVLFAAAAPAVAAQPDMSRVFVQYAAGRANGIEHALQNAGAQFHYRFADLDTFVVTLPSSALQGIENNPSVLLVEEDAPRYVYGNTNAGAYEQALAVLQAQSTPWGVDAVQAPSVWATGNTGAGVTVCIIDTGFYGEHEDLAPAVGGMSQIPGEAYTEDGYGHGTHVAGTIAGLNNGVGVVGVSYDASLYIVKIFDNTGVWTATSNLIAAANDCAANGADIISMSLGGSRSTTEQNAFQDLYDQGVLSIAAAGNDGNTRKSYPASYPSVVSVAAIDSAYNIADFSQQNDAVELAAPGVAVNSTVPFLSTNTLDVDGVTYTGNYIDYAAYGTASGNLVDGGLCTSTSAAFNNAVVLCQRGDISFYDKVMNVQNSGGNAAVIYNNEPGNFFGTLGDGFSSDIPAISLSDTDGGYLVANKLGFNGDVLSIVSQPDSGYEAWNGTSMATPHVSAVAALLWGAYPSATNAEIRDAMSATAFDLGAAGFDNAFGYGLVQAFDAYTYLDGGTPTDNPPTVSITNPSNGATVSGTVNVTADASDDYGVTQVEFFVDGGSIGVDTNGADGYSASWDTTAYANGGYTVEAVATDTAAQTASDSVSATVDNGGVPDPITLSVDDYKARSYPYAALTWSGATTANVDIYKDGVLFITTANDGAYTDGPLVKKSPPIDYQVCEEGTSNCSNIVTASW